jgi:hypothetical protein
LHGRGKWGDSVRATLDAKDHRGLRYKPRERRIQRKGVIEESSALLTEVIVIGSQKHDPVDLPAEPSYTLESPSIRGLVP